MGLGGSKVGTSPPFWDLGLGPTQLIRMNKAFRLEPAASVDRRSVTFLFVSISFHVFYASFA
jgi:hypothetical protein